MRRLLLVLALTCAVSLSAAPLSSVALAAESYAEDDVDPVALAALLISDGHWDRAAAVLREVDESEEGVDLVRLHTLRGLVHLQAGEHALAAASLQRALDVAAAGELATDPWLRLHLAQAWLGAEDPNAALTALDADRETTDALAEAWLLRAQAWRSQANLPEAWVALSQGAARFPERATFDEQRVLLLVEMGLYQHAKDMGQEVLRTREASADTWIIMAEALHRSGQHHEAAVLLEEARLRFPDNHDLPLQLARVYLEDGKPGAAGVVLQVAAEHDAALYHQAAECFRRAGRVDAALRMNALVPEPTEKTRQRLAILLESGDYERMVALAPRLSRLGLLEDDNIRYGLGYAWYQLGEMDAAEGALSGIRDPAIFAQANQLRQAMQACRDSGACG